MPNALPSDESYRAPIPAGAPPVAPSPRAHYVPPRLERLGRWSALTLAVSVGPNASGLTLPGDWLDRFV